MPTIDPVALLNRLLEETAERQWLEFKRNNEDCDLIGRTVCACANAAMLSDRDRAYIVWGIEDNTKRKVGTSIRLNELKKGNEKLENWLAHLIEPRLLMEFLDFEEDGKRFSILIIEPTYDRPVRFSGKEFIRLGDQVKALKDFAEHERALWLATGRRRFENAVAMSHQSAAEVSEKLNLSSHYELKEAPMPTNDAELMRSLSASGFILDDMQGHYDITNLGAILLAKNIEMFPSIATKSVRVVKYSGKDKSKAVGEVTGKKGYAVGFPGMLDYIYKNLPTEEKVTRGVRRAVITYSEIAIREIIANALIHQDFTITGAGPIVEIFEDRIEVTNPGNSLIERDRIIDERRSRNEKLAAAMRELGMCEERGSGIDKAIIDSEERFLPAPEFRSSSDSMRVVIHGPKKFSQLSKADKIWSCFCHCVVRYIRHDPMSNATLRKRFSLPDDEYQVVSVVISDARKAKWIKPSEPGQTRHSRYVPYWA